MGGWRAGGGKVTIALDACGTWPMGQGLSHGCATQSMLRDWRKGRAGRRLSAEPPGAVAD